MYLSNSHVYYSRSIHDLLYYTTHSESGTVVWRSSSSSSYLLTLFDAVTRARDVNDSCHVTWCRWVAPSTSTATSSTTTAGRSWCSTAATRDIANDSRSSSNRSSQFRTLPSTMPAERTTSSVSIWRCIHIAL